jgi:hypothetical protein
VRQVVNSTGLKPVLLGHRCGMTEVCLLENTDRWLFTAFLRIYLGGCRLVVCIHREQQWCRWVHCG